MKGPYPALVRRPPWEPAWRQDLNPRRDIAFPVAVLALQVIGSAVTDGSGFFFHAAGIGALTWTALVVGPLALVRRNRYPVAALWVTFATTLTPSASGFTFPSFIVAFFAAATSGHRLSARLVIAIRLGWTIWLAPVVYHRQILPLTDVLLLAGWLLVLVVAAEAARIRTERTIVTKTARQIDQRRRQSEERLRIARDLHDVVGHNISLITIQASMGLDLIDSQPDQAKAALSAIKAASKETLEELRTMLSTLRHDEESAPRSPVPGLDRLPDLVELTRSAGLNVGIEIVGNERHLPTAVQLAAYRIIQESLTNVARHAGHANVRIRVIYTDSELRVEVADDGKTASGTGWLNGAGSGIAGMRERANALGGALTAGLCPGGGFQVSARLPVRAAS